MEVDPEHDTMLRHHMAAEAIRHPEDQRELFRVDRIQMWTKLRPAVRQFLEAAHEKFELWIHTNGNRCMSMPSSCQNGLPYVHQVLAAARLDRWPNANGYSCAPQNPCA